MNFSVLVLVIAIVLFGVLAFRQMSALILAPLVTIFVIVLSGMPVLDTLLNDFMPATSDYITQYFLIFFVGALFGAVYQFTGAAESIALAMGRLSHNHFVAPMIMCITGLLSFGGVSGFVVFFVVYPIALQMFKRANLTRRLFPAAISHSKHLVQGRRASKIVLSPSLAFPFLQIVSANVLARNGS